MPVEVDLYHCRVLPLELDGQVWEVQEPPFDATNAPSTFTGRGGVIREGETLRYTDGAGALLTFLPDEDVPQQGCA